MDTQNTELLQAGLDALHIEDRHGKLADMLTRYIRELETFNAAFNLIKVQNTQELIIKHILDSLAPWEVLAQRIGSHQTKDTCTIADIGSGAGLPGIPLACLFLLKTPSIKFTLIERMHKRCAVLENIQAMLGLTNTAVLESEAEKAPADYFDIAVFRAFRPLDRTMLATLQKRIRSTGILAAYKGKATAIEEEMQALGTHKPDYQMIPVQTPFYDAERNLVIISKEKL
ncbi:16S rRNA (guanine(527)-N(7))-methyltransferase RsmG [Treponema sp. OMZ 305]|uniref:16S rRNA (guanine(527)-N(7))-methyltransferase RsmG n=1 Tax=Treponema sp. OMZ 305 TaxID=1659192 RepID=UPI0020A37A80|nr:16S rRNA (guanine(527)-N(7))-methyltransferase RsmG [Treponema sp. OMZ 305]UTC57888.1 16S rRNA (guanine(527)-N(7))-methyltransferase RsmG [Treponema sp. OMZ 305]